MKIVHAMVVMCLVICPGYPVQAEEVSAISQEAEAPSLLHQVAMKLVRGLANFTTGWAEIPKQIYLVGQKEGWVTGALRGPMDGIGMFVARTIAGAYEVVSFPLPIPPHYQALLQPDFVWQPEPASDRSETASPSQGSASGPDAKVPSSP
ncbi:MAG: exosortase system-associated protein, TIGR04073 family [Nitrospiraceae bacterium]